MTVTALDAPGVEDTPPVEASSPRWSRSVVRPIARFREVPHLGTWVGMLVTTVGLVLVAVAWGKTAGLLDVGRQIPWLVSAGLTGLALVVVGLTLVNITAKTADANERRRQLAELRDVLAELRRSVEDGR